MGVYVLKRTYTYRLIRLFLLLAVAAGFMTCSQIDPFTPFEAQLSGTNPIDRNTLRGLEGVYAFSDGNSGLGTSFVCKTSKNKVSFFSNERGIFFILKAGLDPTDSTIHLAGFWRVSENKSNGAISLVIPKVHARKLLKQQPVTGLIMAGGFTSSEGKQSLGLQYARDFSANAKSKPLEIFGHHGIQTNSNPPFAENSYEAFRQAQDYGATSLEVDVRLTKDNVPVLYHDPDLNIRVIQKAGIYGDLNQVTFQALSNFVRLIDGQPIPSLDSALTVAIDETELAQVWIDVKGDPDVFKYMEPIMRKAIARAKTKGRNIEFITDLPSDAVIDEYKKQPSYADLPIMCELDLNTTISLKAKYWGPRWTQGTLNDDVARAHSLGMKAYTWTLNAEGFIYTFMRDGNFDGLITDYPAYPVYLHYIQP